MELSGFIGISEVLKSGVYALVHQGIVVYIGKSKSMLIRIYTHRSQYGRSKTMPSWFPVKGILFDEVFIRPAPLHILDSLEADLINLYKPRHNTQLKTKAKSTAPVTLTHNGVDIILNRPRPQSPKLERRI